MNIDFTVTELIAAIKRGAMIPASQLLFQDADLASLLTEQLHHDIVPLIVSMQEDYFVHNADQDIDTTQNKYAVNSRAFGQKLKDVVLLNSSGREVNLPRISQALIKTGQSISGVFPLVNGRGFYFEGDEIVLFPDATTLSGYDLRQKIYRRPNNIVLQSATGQVTAFSSESKTITLANLPVAWVAGNDVDIIKGQPGFKSRADDQDIASIDSGTKTLTMTAALPADIAVGDWVALSGESPIPQIPYEVFGLLTQRTVVKVLEQIGDQTGLQAAADVYKDMVEKFKTMVTPRADDSPKRLVSVNPLFGEGRRAPGWW